ncbi:MAG: gliding motility-associated C-terminal domain-containing protein [Crocinitomicaceae bacterium]|nr:gliding motility-associated C-terminal domain-containing protein [Crocinitomicaceae bacterium]
MRYSLITCALLFGFFTTTAKAQKQTLSVGHDLNQTATKSKENTIRCYTMEMDEQRRTKHSELPSLNEEEHLFQQQLEIYKNTKGGKGDNMNKATLLTIPCIFHIITDGNGAENISAAQVQAQVDQLNIDFRNLAGSTDPVAADVEIEFCLAILDPSDNLLPEQGINRVTDYGEGPFNTGFIDGTIKPGTIWNPDEYMNVWVADITGGILGYAQFPSNSGLGGLNANGGAATTDGVVHLYSTIGSVANPFPGGAPYNLGRTMTHEVGHWLGLRHIWGDANCGNDFCGDTPQSQTSNFGCPNLTSCDGNIDMVENYMDYTNDACMDIFTEDQKDRIRTVMLNCPRRALLPLSEKCGLPQPNISFINTNGGSVNEGVNCDFIDVPVDLQISLPPTEIATVSFTIGGNTTATQGVDFDIIPTNITFPANSSNNQNFLIRIYNDALLEANEVIELEIVVTTTGDAIASSTAGVYTITILDADFVASNILFEDFETGGLGGFTTQGAAGSDLFQNGNTANASSQFWIIDPNNTTQFAYTNDDACNCDKSNDIFTSPLFDLTGITGDVFFEFDHAFSAETYETADVEINTGTGWLNLNTLTNISANNNNTLTTPWVIGNQILLTPYIGANNVRVRFTYNDGGNWAYGLAIDNIRIYTDTPIESNNLSGIDTQTTCGAYAWIDGNTYTTSNNTATYTIVGGAANGCDSLVTLDLTISNTVNGTDQQAACETFTWIDGNTYTASNNTATYTIIGGSVNGCDSIVTLDLTIYANNSTIFTETFDSGTIAGANAPVLYGNGGSDFNPNYALSGTFFGWFNVQNGIGDVDIYEQNFTGLQIGCAVSVAVWMRSTIPVSDVTMTLSDDNGIILSVLDPILSGAWQLVTISATVTTSGLNFLVHFNSTGGNGLDVIMEDLTVTQSCGIDAIIAPVSDQCLNGNSFTFDGMNSLSSAGITSYIWDFGDNSPSINTPSAIYSYANSGTYDVNLNVSDGVCFDDTTIQVNVYEDPLIDNPSDVISCDTYVLPSLSFGNYYSGSDGSGILLNEGDIIDITQSVFVFEATNTVPSCSNENEFIVTINNTITTTDFESSCGPYTWIDGITYNESNTTAVYTYPNVTPSGCDSVVFLNLTVASPTAGTDVLTSCTPVIWIDGNTYTSSNNTATFTIIGGASNGCDSTVNLDLTISSAVYGTDIQVACETFTWIDGINYSSSNNTATFTYPNGAVAGCDSIVTLDLTVNNSISYLDVHESCDNFTWIDGNTYTENNTSASFIYPGGAANGCDSIVTLDLTINNLENLNPGIDLSICDGDSFTPNASGALYYSWSDGLINGSSFTPLIGLNEYTVTGTDINNCSAFASVFVNVSAVPSISFNTIDPFCKGEASGSIAIDIAGGTAPYFIEWSNQSNEANLPNIPAGTYNVIVSDDAGCETEATQILSDPLEPCYELPEASFYVPNSFTPDADEHNQNWFIILEGADPLSYSLRIYNRWGETIWESYDIEAKWDGTYRSLDVPEGTYTWQIEYQNLGESKRIYETGHINLLR